ncbi:MAG: FHA domain-containing protein [Pseudomonadota bacterium]
MLRRLNGFLAGARWPGSGCAGVSPGGHDRARAAQGVRVTTCLLALVLSAVFHPFVPLSNSALAAGDVAMWCSSDAAGRPASVNGACELRALSRAAIKQNEIKLSSSGRDLAFNFIAFEPRVKASAVLFLMQTGGKSHPNNSAREIQRLVNPIGKRKFALYSFSDDLTRVVRFGEPQDQLQKALDRRRARESTTSLFTALDQSLEDLSNVDAARRTIVLLGDGSTGNDAVNEDTIIEKSLRLNIPIFSIAFTDNRVDETIKDGLTVLRSLAERTNGLFEDAGANRVLSDGYINNFYHYIENGGSAEITSALGGGDTVDATVGLSNGRSVQLADIPVRGTRRFTEVADANETDTSSQAVDDDASDPDDSSAYDDDEAVEDEEVSQLDAFLEDPVTWAGDNPFPAASALVAIVGLCALGAIVLMRPKRDDGLQDDMAYGDFDPTPNIVPDPAAIQVGAGNETVLMGIGGTEDVVVPGADGNTHPMAEPSSGSSYAYLEFLDSDETRAPITATNVRIGRHRDNDICIANHSVHRQHAVIVQDSEGQFSIRDLGTKNGIVVNNVRCSQTKLNDGDTIELGEVRLRYVAAS